jgi:hypothetical protein
MFSDLSHSQKMTIYQCLCFAVSNSAGIGFHNSDQRHVAYATGAKDGQSRKDLGDSPDDNELFQMMKALSSEVSLDDCPAINDWQGFCQFAMQQK